MSVGIGAGGFWDAADRRPLRIDGEYYRVAGVPASSWSFRAPAS